MFDPKTRILIVDDFLSMRKTLVNICNEIGFTDVVEAVDGQEAWNALEAANPPIGLIVSDMTMPKMGGLQLLMQVRKDARFAKLPFLMVTAEGEQSQVVAAVKAGVNNYVLKPFTSEVFINKLEAIHKKLGG